MGVVMSIDVETYSDIDIASSGAYRYCESPSFEVMLFAYAFDDEPVRLIDLTCERFPDELMAALQDPEIKKSAFNANFERNTIASHFSIKCPPESWFCTMVQSLRMGLPGSLEMAGKALNFAEDKQKMKEGKALIQYFCKPCKPTKTNHGQDEEPSGA